MVHALLQLFELSETGKKHSVTHQLTMTHLLYYNTSRRSEFLKPRKKRVGTMMQKIEMILILLLFVFNLSKWGVVEAQSLPPAKYDGFLYQHSKPDSDSIVIDAFFDPVCPDSRDAWPPIKQVLQHYGSRVSFVLHLLPLPYHDNAYSTSRALHIANALNASSTFPLLERFFEHQEKFYNAYTQNSSRVAVVKELVKFVSVAVGNSFYPAVEAGFNDRKTDLKTRVSFKYSASRGVYGTPTFFVNGFVLPDAGSPLDYNGWRSVIDPLIGSKFGKGIDPLRFML